MVYRPATQNRIVVASLALALLTVGVFAEVRSFSFTNWDDDAYVTANPFVVRGLTLEGATKAFTTEVAGNWHPLTMLSHMVDVSVFGLSPGAHHLVNLGLHVLNCVLLLYLLQLITGSLVLSWIAAAAFAWHPLHVESVAWVSQRKDLLSTAFLLASAISYYRYTEGGSRWTYSIVVVLYAFSAMSKPMVVTFPIILLLLDFWPLRRLTAQAVYEKLPLLLIAIGIGAVTLNTQGEAIADLSTLTASDRATTVLFSYTGYVQKFLAPVGLSAFYPMRPHGWLAVLGAVAVMVAIVSLIIACVSRRPYVSVGLGWFLIALSPVSGIIQTGEQAIADRYMYVGLVGLTIAAVWAGADLARTGTFQRRVMMVLCAIVLGGWAGLAKQQTTTWKDSEALWRHALRVSSPNYRAETKLAEALRDKGALDEALAHYYKAIDLLPDDSPVGEAILRNGLGVIMTSKGDFASSANQFDQATVLHPTFAEAWSNLGAALSQLGNATRAEEAFRNALKIEPESYESHYGLGRLLMSQHRLGEAEAEFTVALRLNPTLAPALAQLGVVLASLGRSAEGIDALTAAIQMEPGHAVWHYSLGVLLLSEQDVAGARQQFLEATAADPNHGPSQEALKSLSIR
jgi:Flp pilus assembly protein TadD